MIQTSTSFIGIIIGTYGISQTVLRLSVGLLEDYKNNSLKFRDTLDSEEAIKSYYLNYYSQLRTNETKFPIDEQTTTIIELLGENKAGQLQYIRRNGEKVKTKLPQAFLTAGQAFEVISNDYKVSIVVPYNDEARELLDKLSQDYLEIEEQKKILKKLQRYTVGISEKRKEKISFCGIQSLSYRTDQIDRERSN